MVKNILSVMVFVFLLMGNICFASISKDDLVLGNIHYGDSLVQVESSYGSPDKETLTMKHSLWNGIIREARYGKGFLVTYRNGNVIFIQSFEDNNGIETGKGLSVGMSTEDAIKLYGEPDIKYLRHWIWETDGNEGLSISFDNNTNEIFFISVGALD